MTGDDYVTVTTVLRAVRDKSIYVDRRLNDRHEVCIPRSLPLRWQRSQDRRERHRLRGHPPDQAMEG